MIFQNKEESKIEIFPFSCWSKICDKGKCPIGINEKEILTFSYG